MPNHVKTVVKFRKLKPDDIAFILNMIATPCLSTPEGEPVEYVIDFNKIIPEPKTEEECPEEYRMTKESHIMPDDEKPWFNWYKWHIDNWGTKWGAYDGYTKIGKTWIKFVFSTAWSFAEPVMDRLKLLGYDIEIRYADENLGSNCGKVIWTAEQGWDVYTEDDLIDPLRFASDLWNKY